MFIGAILIAIWCAWGCFRWLNEWLPKWIVRQNFWLVEFLYRFHLPSIIIWIILYASAYFIKKIAWKNAYGDYLD